MLFPKIKNRPALSVVKSYLQSEEILNYIPEELSSADYLNQLIEDKEYTDAIKFLSHALPVRESIWWGCVCARYIAEQNDIRFQLGLKASEDWVHEPNEKNRRVSAPYAKESNYETSASWLAAATFWSGGSIAPEDQPEELPEPYLYAHAVSGAILLCAAWGSVEGDKLEARYLKYLNHGLNIARGGNG